MNWDIDKAMERFQTATIPGTIWQQMSWRAEFAREQGLPVSPRIDGRDYVMVWCLGIGSLSGAKHFVYGRTMRECFERLTRQVEDGLQLNPQLFPNLGKPAVIEIGFPKKKPKRKKR
jgi:hypothetical protein